MREFLAVLILVLVVSTGPFTPLQSKTLVLNNAASPPLTNAAGTGFLDIVATEAFRRSGFGLTLIRLPAERGLRNANAGIDDGELLRIGGMEKLYPNLIPVPESILESKFIAFSKKPAAAISGWNDLKDFSVGYVRGWKIFELHVPAGTDVITGNTGDQLMSLLQRERIDIALHSLYLGLEIVRRRNLTEIVNLSPPLATREMFIYLHKKHRALVPKLAAALADIKAEGLYDRELRKIEN